MANTYVTPSMGLILPVPGVEPGPEYAIDQNSSFTLIDTHNHTSGKGVQVPSSGLNINSALSFNNYSLLSARTVAFNSVPSPAISSADVGCLYLSSGDLYFNTLGGVPVALTSGAAISGGTISGLPAAPPYSTAGVAFATTTGSGIYTFTQSTLVNATLAMGSAYLTYPGFYPSPSGNGIILKVPSTIASQYSLTLPALPGQTNVMTLSSTGVISSITYDAVGQAMTAGGANAIAATMTSVGTGSLVSTMTSGNADTIAGKISTTGTDSIAATMTAGNANTIFGKVTVFPTASADAIAAAITSTGTTSLATTMTAANANTSLGKVSSVGVTQANLVGGAMTSTGADAVAAVMSTIGTTSIAATMTAANSNTILGKVSSVGATQANLVGSAMTSTGADAVAATITTTGTGSLATTMTAANANTIFGKVTVFPTASADAIAAAITTTGTTSLAATMTAANANTSFGKVSSVGATQANLVGSAMTATGADAVAAAITSTGTGSLAATMTAANANTSFGKVSSVAVTQANLVGSAMTSTGANSVIQVSTRSTGTTAAVLGVAISTGSSTFSTNSITFTTVCTATLTTSGRPVYVGVVSTGGSSGALIDYFHDSGTYLAQCALFRDTTQLATFNVSGYDITAGVNATGFGIQTIDVVSAGGPYAYTLQAKVGDTSGILRLYVLNLVAYEL